MTTPMVERGVFTLAEVSAYLNLNHVEIRRLLRVGELTGWRTLGPNRGDWRISRAAADEWIALQEERGRQELAK